MGSRTVCITVIIDPISRFIHTFIPTVFVLVAVVLNPAIAQGQTAADLFNPDLVQEIRLSINSRDLRELHEPYQENTYYTADLWWQGVRVRNVGVRSRGTGSRNPIKLGLRVDFDRYTTGQTFLGGLGERAMSFTTIVLWPVLVASLGIPKTPLEPLSTEAAIIGTATAVPQSAEPAPPGGASPLVEGFSDLRGRTALDMRFYRPDIWVDGNRRRIGTELRSRPEPFSMKSEYIRVTDERRGQSVDDTDLSPAVAAGWYVSGTWAVTGETKAKGLDAPPRPFLRGGFGVIEVAARVERLSFDSAATGGDASERPQAMSSRAIANRVETLPDKTSYWSRMLRFQLAL